MRLVTLFRVLRSLPQSIYFNFHYLPFRQAVKLPILLYKPHFRELKGTVRIEAGVTRTGMVKLGFPTVSLCPNSGIMVENHGGDMVFRGRAGIGNASCISVGPRSVVEFGDYFQASAAFKLASYCGVRFAPRVRVGWECTFMDTDLHKLTKVNGGGYSKGYAPISVGPDCWIGMGTLVLKGTALPGRCVVGARSVLSGKQDVPPCSILAGHPAVLKKSGYWRNIEDDKIEYKPDNDGK